MLQWLRGRRALDGSCKAPKREAGSSGLGTSDSHVHVSNTEMTMKNLTCTLNERFYVHPCCPHYGSRSIPCGSVRAASSLALTLSSPSMAVVPDKLGVASPPSRPSASASSCAFAYSRRSCASDFWSASAWMPAGMSGGPSSSLSSWRR